MLKDNLIAGNTVNIQPIELSNSAVYEHFKAHLELILIAGFKYSPRMVCTMIVAGLCLFKVSMFRIIQVEMKGQLITD